MSTYAVLGGTFDPVHCGHVALVKYVLSYLQGSKVIVSCAYQNPHKVHGACADARHRLAMVHLAFADMARVCIDEGEIESREVSYTIDLILRLREKYKVRGKMYFIVGEDIIENLHRWKHGERLAELVTLLVYPRLNNGGLNGYAPVRCVRPLSFFDAVYMDAAPCVTISSSDIRTAYRERRAVAYALSPSVAAYIRDHMLYT